MNQIEKWIDKLFAKWRWLLHVFFWMAILFFYVVFFGRTHSNYLHTFFFVGLLMPVVIIATYLLNYFLIPKFLFTGRHFLFFLYTLYLLIFALFLELTVTLITFLLVAQSNIKNLSPATFDLVLVFTSLLMVIALAVAVKLLLSWRQSKEDYEKLMREKIEMELRFLKTQLNPHFLFNTLNNLYYLTEAKSDQAPQAILSLSEMLDYVLHSSQRTWVSLAEECKQAENYINLELMRYGDRLSIIKKFEGSLNEYQIAPMVIITLIENAFKHGVSSAYKAWIELTVKAEKDVVEVVVRNSISKITRGNGIGLENLKSQLSLLYAQRHEIRFIKNSQDFSVELILRK